MAMNPQSFKAGILRIARIQSILIIEVLDLNEYKLEFDCAKLKLWEAVQSLSLQKQ